MPDFVLVRHGESTYNLLNLLNGDPSVTVPLSDEGRRQCALLNPTLGAMEWASAWTTRFPRTKESLALIAPDCAAVAAELPALDDIDVGTFEGQPITEFRAWRRGRQTGDIPPQGESLEDVVNRYAEGFFWLLAHAARPALIVTHDQPIRFAMNALAGDDPIAGTLRKVPNAVPYPFSAVALQLAAERLRDHRLD